MNVDVFVVNEQVATLNCPNYERYGRGVECKNSVPPCKNIPIEFYEKYRQQLEHHQAYGFLCYAKKEV